MPSGVTVLGCGSWGRTTESNSLDLVKVCAWDRTRTCASRVRVCVRVGREAKSSTDGEPAAVGGRDVIVVPSLHVL